MFFSQFCVFKIYNHSNKNYKLYNALKQKILTQKYRQQEYHHDDDDDHHHHHHHGITFDG
jgi:hypothetical protein